MSAAVEALVALTDGAGEIRIRREADSRIITRARRMPRSLNGDECERGWFQEGDAIPFLSA